MAPLEPYDLYIEERFEMAKIARKRFCAERSVVVDHILITRMLDIVPFAYPDDITMLLPPRDMVAPGISDAARFSPACEKRKNQR